MYQIRGFQSADTGNGCDAERDADTLTEARRQARYMLSYSYRVNSEAERDLLVAQIWKGDRLIEERIHPDLTATRIVDSLDGPARFRKAEYRDHEHDFDD